MEGGSDTTASILTAFIQAMIKWPEVQQKAQAHIDAVVGQDRTPQWSDYASLPYIAQCVKEAQRWRPVVPLGFPHAVGEDDWVEGMLIPKGTTVIVNAYGMQHDETRFPNPDIFDPDHYEGVTALATELNAGDAEKRDHWGYGAGRRFCPGAHLAERNLWVAIAKMLWAFKFEPSLGEDGNVVEPDVSNETGYSAGFLVCACPFGCKVTPRSDVRRATILKEFEDAKKVFAKYETPKA